MSKIAALQFPTLALSESRLDYYLKASKDNGVNLVVLGEYRSTVFLQNFCICQKI